MVKNHVFTIKYTTSVRETYPEQIGIILRKSEDDLYEALIGNDVVRVFSFTNQNGNTEWGYEYVDVDNNYYTYGTISCLHREGRPAVIRRDSITGKTVYENYHFGVFTSRIEK